MDFPDVRPIVAGLLGLDAKFTQLCVIEGLFEVSFCYGLPCYGGIRRRNGRERHTGEPVCHFCDIVSVPVSFLPKVPLQASGSLEE